MDSPSIDLDYLERFCKGDTSRMQRYIRMYLEAAPALFQQLAEKAREGDADALAIAAHSLRPQANYMGAHKLLELLTSIETSARQQGAAACALLVAQLPAVNEGVMNELRKVLGPA